MDDIFATSANDRGLQFRADDVRIKTIDNFHLVLRTNGAICAYVVVTPKGAATFRGGCEVQAEVVAEFRRFMRLAHALYLR